MVSSVKKQYVRNVRTLWGGFNMGKNKKRISDRNKWERKPFMYVKESKKHYDRKRDKKDAERAVKEEH